MYKPVAYDKSVRQVPGGFRATIRFDGSQVEAERHSLEEAQRVLDCFPPDVFEGPDVPKSVFYRSRR